MHYRPLEKLGDCRTIADVLTRRAEREPNALAYVFTDDAVRDTRLTYAQLDEHARAVSSVLVGRGLARTRVVLAMPSGLPFVWGFFGTLYARATAVPVALPRSFEAQDDSERERLLRICMDCRPSVILTVGALAPFLEAALEHLLGHMAPPVLAIDELDPAPANDASRLVLSAEDVAVLQYTSGSTGDPRGVLVKHENIMANQIMITDAFDHDESTIVGGWLPHYHDMGLIGILLHPLYLGVPSFVMPPLSFAQRPHLWPRLIDRYRVTSTGGPSFAYDVCARRCTDAQLAGLDLSCWKVAFDGSEPVRAASHRRFAERFAPYGFRASSFVPSYGLAEATLFVTGGPRHEWRRERVERVDPEALASGTIVPNFGPDAIELVGCGKGHADQTLRIVDPERLMPLPDGAVGEIWVKGPHVATGYFGWPALTRETFGAMLGDEGPFLRTGDLGFVKDGELFVTGRSKDLIIVHGKNYYPHDLEETFARALGTTARNVVALRDESEPTSMLRMVVELAREAPPPGDHDLVRARRAVFIGHGLAVTDVLVVPAGAIPRTSSGKKQRRRLAQIIDSAAIGARQSA